MKKILILIATILLLICASRMLNELMRVELENSVLDMPGSIDDKEKADTI